MNRYYIFFAVSLLFATAEIKIFAEKTHKDFYDLWCTTHVVRFFIHNLEHRAPQETPDPVRIRRTLSMLDHTKGINSVIQILGQSLIVLPEDSDTLYGACVQSTQAIIAEALNELYTGLRIRAYTQRDISDRHLIATGAIHIPDYQDGTIRVDTFTYTKALIALKTNMILPEEPLSTIDIMHALVTINDSLA